MAKSAKARKAKKPAPKRVPPIPPGYHTAAFKRAIDAGATSLMPPADMFWGDRFGKLRDPFGVEWSMATHKEDVPPKQMAERAKAAMAQTGSGE
jgi:hypothetical protein